MIEYRVVTTPRQDRLEETVTQMLNEGWVLHGNTFVAGSGGMTQTLIRETKEAPKGKASPTGKAKSNED
jgi:hypothetical protein|tara:strand:- start:1053 stop:1259 length:207 start_codon:yes stop_codon:yes gene_type:complete